MEDKKVNVISEKNNKKPVLHKFLIALSAITPFIGNVAAQAQLKPDEHVMFIPDIAYEDGQGKTVAHIQAWVYEKEKRRGLTRMLALFLGIEISKLLPEKRQKLYERTQLFRVDSERNKTLFIRDEADNIYQMPKTTANGRSQVLVPINFATPKPIQEFEFQLVNGAEKQEHDGARAIYAAPLGRSIISDIDDTIKLSSVKDKKQLLINTFLEDFIAVDGMAKLYKSMNLDHDVAYHYVSSSPIQLYPVLQKFMATSGYPVGSMHLREATRWNDIIPMPNASRMHKMKMIERILKAYPKRTFLLIGDSSENDPIIYAHFFRLFPKQIEGIIIRDVRSNKDEKDYAKIFYGIDTTRWIVTSSIDAMRIFIQTLSPHK